jgi:membrane protein YdbS with pleckstrin-like domain
LDDKSYNQGLDIPDDALIVGQSNWAWMWASTPWVILFGLSIAFDFLTFGILPIIFASIVIIPRFLATRRTKYIVTSNELIIQQGSITGYERISIPLIDLSTVTFQPGRFGNLLGYTGVHLQLNDGRIAILNYVPANANLGPFIKTPEN